MAESDLTYAFTCPNCAGTFSILLERIPPVQARFRCPHCKQHMDFPSREEARIYARLQVQTATPPPPSPPPEASEDAGRGSRAPAKPTTAARESTTAARESTTMSPDQPPDTARFRVEKPGFESDEYDRRAIRNLSQRW